MPPLLLSCPAPIPVGFSRAPGDHGFLTPGRSGLAFVRTGWKPMGAIYIFSFYPGFWT